MTRIERALDRLEAAASAPERDEVERLRLAHATLRERVESAMGEIDRMLAGDRQDPA